MKIQELRNLYFIKILKHINKVNSELSLYNQSSEQRGGSSLASIEPKLGPPQLIFTQHNKSAIDSILILKGKIEKLKINEQKINEEKNKLEELYNSLSKLNTSNKDNIQSSDKQIINLKNEIVMITNHISELEKINLTLNSEKELLKLENIRINEEQNEQNELNTRLQTDNQKISDQVRELNSNIEKISKESITSLFTRSKELIEFYYFSSIDIKNKTDEIVKEIRQLGKEPKQPKQPEMPEDLKQIYETFIGESYKAASDIQNDYDINFFDKKLRELQDLLNIKISQAKEINEKLYLQYEVYLTEKDTLLATLTNSL